MIAWSVTVGIALILALVGWAVFRHWRRPRPVATPFAETSVQMITAGDWAFRYHISGHGPHLLLIHGLGADLFCWRFLIPLLVHKYTVVAVDLPGFGRSSKLNDAHYGLDDQAARLRLFLQRIGVRKTYIVGSSMGGNIALWLKLTAPDLCLGCAVISPALSNRLVPLSLKPWLWMARPLSYLVSRGHLDRIHRRTVTNQSRIASDRVEETFRTYGRNSAAVRSFLASTECIRDPRLAKRLSEILPGVLILWGSEDKIVPVQVIDGLESAAQACETYVHEGGGHHLQEDDPEWVSGKIDAFFSTSHD